MCTLTLNKVQNTLVFTSNRDDNVLRNATEFVSFSGNNNQIYYPKDKLTEGTWLAFDQQGNLAILLNGCDEKHTKMPYHTKSRGYIALDFFKMNTNIEGFAQKCNFNSFEPFTLVVLKNNQLQELKWNEKDTQATIFKEIPNHKIWSSVTLYNKESRVKRERIFDDFIRKSTPHKTKIFSLLSTQTKDLENGFCMQRPNVQTLATSQIEVLQNEIRFKAFNHISKETNQLNIPTNEVLV